MPRGPQEDIYHFAEPGAEETQHEEEEEESAQNRQGEVSDQKDDEIENLSK